MKDVIFTGSYDATKPEGSRRYHWWTIDWKWFTFGSLVAVAVFEFWLGGK